MKIDASRNEDAEAPFVFLIESENWLDERWLATATTERQQARLEAVGGGRSRAAS